MTKLLLTDLERRIEDALDMLGPDPASDYEDENEAVSEVVDGVVPVYNSDLADIAAGEPCLSVDDLGLLGSDGDVTIARFIQVAIYEHLQSHAWEYARRNETFKDWL